MTAAPGGRPARQAGLGEQAGLGGRDLRPRRIGEHAVTRVRGTDRDTAGREVPDRRDRGSARDNEANMLMGAAFGWRAHRARA